MAFQFLLNQTPASGFNTVWNWISTLKTASWTVVSDSDGSTYASSGGQVTGPGSGANGIGNPYAWVRLKTPTGTRELLFQNNNSTDGRFWRIIMSPSAGFVIGSPSATQTPDATDMFYFAGSGSGGSPSFSIALSDNNSYYQQIIADNASPYSWYMITYLKAGDDVQTVYWMDGLASSSIAAGDTDPYGYYANIRNSTVLNYSSLNSETQGPSSYLDLMGTPVGPICAPYVAFFNAGQQIVPAGCGSNSFTNKDEEFPCIQIRRGALSAPTGYKGVSNNIRWKGSNRSTGGTFSGLTRAIFGDVSFPWDGSTTPSL